MFRRTSTLVVSLFVALALLSPLGQSQASARIADRDCGDFATQAAAQRFFLDHGGPRDDPHRLDEDGDGIACESNPCPCSFSTSPGDDGPEPGTSTSRRWAKIVRVIDGDTVVVRLAGGPKVHVRLIGIDSPETSPAECGSANATRSARQLMPRGKRVLLLSDSTQRNKDRYGRFLRYVVRNGNDVNRAQVARGWARVYVVGREFKRVDAYRRSQRVARNQDRGIWGRC